jgi:hypothetical protein
MKPILTLSFLLLSASIASSQETPVTPVADTHWTHTLAASLTATQVSLSDWKQGGENLFSYFSSADGKSGYKKEQVRWENRYKFAFAQAKLGERSTRKTEDRIELESVFLYGLGVFVDPYVAASLKTQFAKGYDYDPVTDQATMASDFFDPAYLTQSVGGGMQITPELKTRLGFGLREIITRTFTVYSDDPTTTEVEKVRVDGGFESVSSLDWSLEENLLLSWQLELFAPLSDFNELTIRSNTSITAKVGKYVITNLTVQMINDPIVSTRTQIKQTLSLGLSYVVF